MANRTSLRQKFDKFKKRPNCSCRKYLQHIKQDNATSPQTGKSWNRQNRMYVHQLKQEVATTWKTGSSYISNTSGSVNWPRAVTLKSGVCFYPALFRNIASRPSWILPKIYFPLHSIHMNSATNLLCSESHLFLLWREQMEGIWYHQTPYFSVTGLGPFTLPLILLM